MEATARTYIGSDGFSQTTISSLPQLVFEFAWGTHVEYPYRYRQFPCLLPRILCDRAKMSLLRKVFLRTKCHGLTRLTTPCDARRLFVSFPNYGSRHQPQHHDNEPGKLQECPVPCATESEVYWILSLPKEAEA